MQARISIEMNEYGNCGWEFKATFYEPYLEKETVLECRTNGNGHGLWFWNSYRHMYKQTRGTCQFSLSSKRRNAYQQLRRWIERNYLQVG